MNKKFGLKRFVVVKKLPYLKTTSGPKKGEVTER
jgi:hypothetical protein